MKKVYERPMMYIEAFVANEAVSACNTSTGFNYKFDCMRGGQVDTENVFTSGSCTNAVGYQAKAQPTDTSMTAINYDTDAGHSNNNSGSGITADWTGSTSTYTKVVYTGTFDGLVYINGGNESFNTRNWTASGNTITHSDANGADGTHIMVAPLVSYQTVSASW